MDIFANFCNSCKFIWFYKISVWTVVGQLRKLLTGYRRKIKDHTRSENILDQKRQLHTNQSSDIIQVIENINIYDGQRYTLNRRRHGTDEVKKSYYICTVSGCKARFVLHDQRVKNSPLHNHGDQQAEITVHRAKVQLKSRAATSDMSSKRIVAQTVSGLDFESRAKLACQLNCLGKMARSSKTAANRHPPNPTSLENLVLQPSHLLTPNIIVTIYTSGTRASLIP